MHKVNTTIVSVVFLVCVCHCIRSQDALAEYYGFSLDADKKEPVFLTEIDHKYYLKLAGIYAYPQNEYDIDSIFRFSKGEYSWGHDYSLGKYSACIDYSSKGGWRIHEGGSVDYFKIVDGNDNSITIEYPENYTPRRAIITFSGNDYSINGSEYYKISGPENPMSLLSRLLGQKEADLAYSIIRTAQIGIAYEEIARKSDLIRNAIILGDYTNLQRLYSSSYGIRFGLDDCPISIKNAIKENEDYNKNILLEAAALQYWGLDPYEIYINKYKYISAKKIHGIFDNPITVEYYGGIYNYYVMIFVVENGELKLAAIIDRIAME